MAHLAGLTVIVLDCTLNLVLTNDSFDDPNEQLIKVVSKVNYCLCDVIKQNESEVGNNILVSEVLFDLTSMP